MDWIQWYFIVLFIGNFCASCWLHGKARPDWDVRWYPVSFLITLPYAGRIIGLW